MKARAQLTIVPLEDRAVPAGFGTAWVDTNVTVSFAPDGTDVAGAGSTLFEALGSRATPAEWQGAVAAAFQAWVAPTNLNFAVASDDGRPVGSPGPVQGSPHVGDIRIVARPLSDNVLAITNPFDLVSSWAGEIVLNSNKVFDTDGSADAYDLKTVLLQEAGHALGLGNSPDPTSVMFGSYAGPRTGLSAEDVSGIRGLYGVRAADRFDAITGNGDFNTATPIRYLRRGTDLTSGLGAHLADGDLTTAGDVDVYSVRVPGCRRAPTIAVQTEDISSVRLTVSVCSRAGRLLATTSTPDADGNYRLPLPKKSGPRGYFIRVAANTDGGFTVGSYRLAVGNRLTAVPPAIDAPAGPVAAKSATATPLDLSHDGTDARWDYTAGGTIDATGDRDLYEVRAGADADSTMVVFVSTPEGGVSPGIAVYGGDGKQIPTETLFRSGDATIVQLAGAEANATYFVAVESAGPAKWRAAEGYQVAVDFRAESVAFDPLAAAGLSAAQPQVRRDLEVTRSQGFRFRLTAAGAADAGARLTVIDAAGQAALTMVAAGGRSTFEDVLLAPGAYRVVIVGGTVTGSPLSDLDVTAGFLPLTDPIGPGLDDGYDSPPSASDPPPPDGGGPSPEPGDGYSWAGPAEPGVGFLAQDDPYSRVWW